MLSIYFGLELRVGEIKSSAPERQGTNLVLYLK